MIRRRFLVLIGMAGATGVTALATAGKHTGGEETVTYSVRGFTCITCATGLEMLLGREKGVMAVKASYPDGIATVRFRPHVTTEVAVRTAIESMGFTARLLNESAA